MTAQNKQTVIKNKMQDIDTLISKLSSLDLTNYPYDEVKKLLKQIGKIGYVLTVLHKGTQIIRLRPNPDWETFSNVKDLSYKPQEFNKTYQRASTPNNTMFYGSSNQIDNPNAKPTVGRNTALIEGFRRMLDINSVDKLKVTYSNWVVQEDIFLVTIRFNELFNEKHPEFKFVYKNFKEYLAKHSEKEKETIKFSEFLSREFSKPEANSEKDYLYLISATFSEIVSQKYDGIIYPSVRTVGEGVNIALKPEIIDSGKIKCQVVMECIISKDSNQEIIVNNHSKAFLSDNQTEFKLELMSK